MAAYRRVYDLSHLRADCLHTGISYGPDARKRVWEAFTFSFYLEWGRSTKFKVIVTAVTYLHDYVTRV